MGYRKNKISKTYLAVNQSYEGESLEYKIQRLVKNKEPLDGSVPLTYTERKDGVRPEMNIRTDRWEIAAAAMDKAHKSKIAQRDNKGEKPNGEGKETSGDQGSGEAKPAV